MAWRGQPVRITNRASNRNKQKAQIASSQNQNKLRVFSAVITSTPGLHQDIRI
jgi:hypothetical protein